MWLIIVVLAANACSWNFTASRLIYAGGRTGVFPAVFGKLSKRNIPVSSLVTQYALSVSLISGCYLFKVPITSMMLLVNQNFIFLCGFIIIAYWKTETSWQKWFFSVLALLSLSFLASGFTLEGYISGLSDRAWLFQVYRKERFSSSEASRFPI